MKTFRYIFDKFCKSIVTKTDLQAEQFIEGKIFYKASNFRNREIRDSPKNQNLYIALWCVSWNNMETTRYHFFYNIGPILVTPILNRVMSYNQFCVIANKVMRKKSKNHRNIMKN